MKKMNLLVKCFLLSTVSTYIFFLNDSLCSKVYAVGLSFSLKAGA